ncbi:MAG: hypothetical protein AAF619_13730 [Pseudomonadota bacterium]
MRLLIPIRGSERPHGKGIAMTFDLERYRAHIAPLGLAREREDEALRDLWLITETLVDQALKHPETYPSN